MDSRDSDLICSICLDTFHIPVTIPCGHSYCQKCITSHWDITCKSDIGPCCPFCNTKFASRPILNRNVSLSRLTEAAISNTGASRKDCGGEEGGPILCEHHHKPLVYYCKRDKMSVCYECAILDCKNHEKDLLETEKKNQKLLLENKNEEVTKLIEETKQSINKLTENITQAKETMQQTSTRVTAKFSNLIKILAERQEATERFMEQEKEAAVAEATARLADLEDNARKLKASQARIATLHNLSDAELIKESMLVEVPRLKKIPSDVTPHLQDRLNAITEVMTRISKLVVEDLERAVCTVLGQDSEGSPQEKRPILAVVPSPAAPCHPDGREGISAYRCCLTFDPNSANGNLVLSRENQRAEHLTSGLLPVADHESRFDYTWQVLCSQGFQQGQHYWELEVSKPWAYLGVTYAGIPRKEKGRRCILGMNELSWSLQLDEKQLNAWHNGRKETLAGSSRHGRIGVLLDYEAGTLTFYGDGHVRLHAFHCAFAQELFPACWIGEGVSITLCSS
ncbi:E3 ubiquitin-protein ligase TRIM65 [Corythoichthys intestinalis]|uniref:E3 ubiquitin-protein ligase TRIM65 n=1 Tax=Corythoichthys intestinalis TaxID=161448 RepID=UPI0025A5EA2C|nr:E3 ubiquitin-protein ligase TRIM65 [Corythoichthys intestinalis]XP_057682270.1 E3 ubiquitin-protein ligase TRIM65 [Corythoichthys intestinalis]XP_061807194.1 E3 ubiquitin-protein ligase TRIM65 [Nerophis lumbriciformis]